MYRSHFAIALTLACLAGCSTFDLKKNIPWGAGEEGKLERPMKLVANWSETVMTNGDAPPMRGFGGRLVFYAHEGGKPVKVAGTLTVYAFDESKGLKDDVVPDRKFVFTEEQFANHYSDKGMLKHSYSFWIPWDELGGEKRDMSLLCRFVSAQGDVVISEQTRHILPGKPPKNVAVPETLAVDHPAVSQPAQNAQPMVQQVGFFDSQQSTAMPERPRMNTSTIDLGTSPNLGPQANVIDVRGIPDAGSFEGAMVSYEAPAQRVVTAGAQATSQGRPLGAAPQPSVHSAHGTRPAPRAPAAPPVRGRGLYQRPRAGSQSGLAIQRPQGPATARGSNPGSLFPPANSQPVN